MKSKTKAEKLDLQNINLAIIPKPNRAFKKMIDEIILDGKNKRVIEILQCVDKFCRNQEIDFYEAVFVMFNLLEFLRDEFKRKNVKIDNPPLFFGLVCL
ncbi:MAG: hypothetical protein QW769_10070 [Nitrososphaerales archaeon]